MKRVLLLFGSILLFSSAHGQQVLNLLTGEIREGSDAAKPLRTIEILDDGYLVTWDFSEAILSKDQYCPNCVLWGYSVFFMYSDFQGTPTILYQTEWLDIDHDITPSIEILDSAFTDFNYQLGPALPPQPDCDCEEIPRLPITPYEGFYPASVIRFDGISYLLGQNYAVCVMFPILYNYEKQMVRAYTHVSYKVCTSENYNGIEDLNNDKEVNNTFYSFDGLVPIRETTRFYVNSKTKLYLK